MTNKDGYMKDYYEKHKNHIKSQARKKAKEDFHCDICKKTMKYSVKSRHIKTTTHKLKEQLYLSNRLK